MSDIFDGLSDTQASKLREYIGLFRTTIFDYDKEKNILLGEKLEFLDSEVYRFLKRATKDINSGAPRTKYTMFEIDDDDLLIDGAVIFSLIGKGLLQLRNQLSYSDGGLSVDMFNKTSGYSEWARMFLQMYMIDKQTFKASIIPNSYNAGFSSVGSEFGYYFGVSYDD